jgi:beta-glucanase (GH16 family)
MRYSIKTSVLLFIISSCSIKTLNATTNDKSKEIFKGYKLIWSDEFDKPGKPDSLKWNFEHGFVRNEEDQFYTNRNAYIKKGLLIIEGRKEKVFNPEYKAGTYNWRHSREFAYYTSASINTRDIFSFQYGILEVKARIDTSMGLWPAIWTLGVSKEWPSCGEIDVMESYPTDGIHYILANTAWGTNRRWNAKWNTSKIPLTHFLAKNSEWPSQFHVWRMVWNEHFIRLYLDEELLNETNLDDTFNPDGFNPFRQPHYILLNLAIGGQNGGDPTYTNFPTHYEVDYVRVYQKK